MAVSGSNHTFRLNNASRHGRGCRSSVYGLNRRKRDSRSEVFSSMISLVAENLSEQLSSELSGVSFCFVTLPLSTDFSSFELAELTQIPLWRVDRVEKQIVFFRVPVQRANLRWSNSVLHRKLFAEKLVYLAVADYLGCYPWQLFPDNPDFDF